MVEKPTPPALRKPQLFAAALLSRNQSKSNQADIIRQHIPHLLLCIDTSLVGIHCVLVEGDAEM